MRKQSGGTQHPTTHRPNGMSSARARRARTSIANARSVVDVPARASASDASRRAAPRARSRRARARASVDARPGTKGTPGDDCLNVLLGGRRRTKPRPGTNSSAREHHDSSSFITRARARVRACDRGRARASECAEPRRIVARRDARHGVVLARARERRGSAGIG